jgi:hypothetical protein
MAFDENEHKNTLECINVWWWYYKEWEGRDTFLAAFKQGRMTIRQGPALQTYGEYQGKPAEFAFGANRGTEEKVPYPQDRYRTGMDSVKERLDPSNFGMDSGERLKYKKGLHDLSGSLCTPVIPLITKQLRWKHAELSQFVTIFMPMAEPEDIALFHLLNSMAKVARTARPEIHSRVKELNRQMSRIKLAEAGDIGSGLRDVAPLNSNVPKFRYGFKQTQIPDQKGEPTGQDLRRRNNALNYKSILPTPPTPIVPTSNTSMSNTSMSNTSTSVISTSGAPPPPPPMPTTLTSNMNEIVIAYRQHEGTRFPLFTRWQDTAKAFVCLKDEPGSTRIGKGMIPDRWALTVEV